MDQIKQKMVSDQRISVSVRSSGNNQSNSSQKLNQTEDEVTNIQETPKLPDALSSKRFDSVQDAPDTIVETQHLSRDQNVKQIVVENTQSFNATGKSMQSSPSLASPTQSSVVKINLEPANQEASRQ